MSGSARCILSATGVHPRDPRGFVCGTRGAGGGAEKAVGLVCPTTPRDACWVLLRLGRLAAVAREARHDGVHIGSLWQNHSFNCRFTYGCSQVLNVYFILTARRIRGNHPR